MLVVCSRISMGAIFVKLDVASGIWVDLCLGCALRSAPYASTPASEAWKRDIQSPATWIGGVLAQIYSIHYPKNPIELEEAQERLNELREEAIRQADLVLEAYGCATHQRDIFIAIRLASYMAYRLSR